MSFGKILLVGYGSIGKRHARNLISLGVTPHILTKHPDRLNARFLKSLNVLESQNFQYCIISSPTARHLDDLKECARSLNRLKKVLIEKPLECSYSKAKEIRNIAKDNRLEIFTAYNLRFLDVFDVVFKFLKKREDKVRIVEVVAGQDLKEWRPYKNITQSYSAYRELGGGVDLDLSHEIDYILWLFRNRFKDKVVYRAKISNLGIKSPDICKVVLDYRKFIVDITLDYIRKPKQRHLKIFCDNGENLHYDFVMGALKINGKIILNNGDNIDTSYKKMLRAFLDIDKINKAKLCSVQEGLNVLKVLEV